MAATNLVQYIFLLLHSFLMSTEVLSATVTLKPDNLSLICTNPDYQYVRHPLDCSRWFHCSHEQPTEMPTCIDSMTFSMVSLTCLTKQNEDNDCISTCIFDDKLYYLGEIFVGRNTCEKCICQNNRGIVVCSNACLTKGVTCYHQETIYVAGETFLHLDGQQTCTCRVDGVVSCSLSHAEQTEDKTCLYDQKWYGVGVVFISVDHCNQCECLDSGHVTCTTFNCSSPRPLLYEQKALPFRPKSTCFYKGKQYNAGETFSTSCDICYCSLDRNVNCIRLTCSPALEFPKSFIAAPNVASTPLTRTNSKLMRIVSRSTPLPDSVYCDYNGRKYKILEIFPSQDECNTCECLYLGTVHCSKFLCHDQKERILSAPIPTRTLYHATTTEIFPTTPTLEAIPCFYNGVQYKLWDVFPLDDCNTCDCLYHGFVHCTDLKCMAKKDIPVRSESVLLQKSDTCIYKDKVYKIGHTFLSEDKCTICNCTHGASISCTDVHCPSENIHLNDRKSKLRDNILPMSKVSRSPSVTVVSTTQKMTPASVGNREVCWYNGLSYQSGDKFNSEDNCNTCSCMPDSLVTCTKLPCTSKNILGDESTCAYNDHIYQNGQMFNSADGCNTCGCLDGIILCTSHVCRFGKNKFKVPVVTMAPVKCAYNGKTYNAGVVFNSTDNCNLCNCTNTGQVKCTQKTCRRQPDILQYDAPAHVPVSITCSFEGRPYKPRQIFQMADGCSVCTCTDDGRIICTNKKCLLNNNKTKERQSSEVIFTTTAMPSTFCIYEEQTFQAGDIFSTIDGCNSCNCTLDGEVKCTQRRCPLNIAGQSHVVEDSLSVHVGATCIYKEQVYKPQQFFPSSDGCNTCRCSDLGQIHCTDILCPVKSNQSKTGKTHLAVKINSTAKAPIFERCSYNRQTYMVGDTFYSVDDCNMCNCSHNGVVKCSRKSCLPHNKTLRDETSGSCIFGGKEYTVGDTFDLADGCNICGCSDNGELLCTNRTCYLGIVQNRESSYVAPTPTPQVARPKKTICHYNGHSYISGRIFKAADSCNMCGCLQNGVVHCTKNICNFKMVQTTVPPRTAAIPKNVPLVKCRYFGKKYNVGQMFAVQNGCNMCACLAEGIVRCTKQRCDPPVVICKHDRNVYFIGQTFADECNTCKCGSHGVITCTELHCGTEDDGRCQYHGQEHEQGETFRSGDGCHLCTCYRNARISCRPAPCQVVQNHFDTSRERSEEEYLDD